MGYSITLVLILGERGEALEYHIFFTNIRSIGDHVTQARVQKQIRMLIRKVDFYTAL